MNFYNNSNNVFKKSFEKLDLDMEDSSILAGSHLNKIDLSNYYCSNQSTILAGNMLHDLTESNNDKCTIKTNHEESSVVHQNESIDSNDSGIDILNVNIDAIVNQSEIFSDSLEFTGNRFSFTESIRNISQEKKWTPIVDVTSSEQSNGKFLVQMHIKGFKEDMKHIENLKFK